MLGRVSVALIGLAGVVASGVYLSTPQIDRLGPDVGIPVIEGPSFITNLFDNKAQAASYNPSSVRYFKLNDGVLREVTVLPAPTPSDASVEASITKKLETAMAQSHLIEQVDLRDRAFLGVVDYAVDNSRLDVAISAMENIEQLPMRDTARSRIAIGYAQSGNSDAAFAQIEDVEVAALQDVLRLQVIEALIPPER